MNKKPVSTQLHKLESNKLWRAATDVAVYAYRVLHEFPEEEQYGMQPNLRERAFDLTSDIAEAVGSIDPRDRAYSYGRALRDAYSVRNTLVVAGKTGVLDIEPSVIVKLDNLIDDLVAETAETTNGIPAYLKSMEFQDETA